MKKVIRIIVTAALAATLFVVTLAFAGCGTTASYSGVSTPDFDGAAIRDTLERFVTENADRTSLTRAEAGEDNDDGEARAAQWLMNELETRLPGVTPEKQGVTVDTAYNDRFDSQNVIVHIDADESANPDDLRIVIGTRYDNAYSSVRVSGYDNYYYVYGTRADGALSSGSGVATVLALAEKLYAARDELTVDVDIVFYGAGLLGSDGPSHYLSTNLGSADREKLILAVSVEDLGGDELLAYFDEVSTAHGKFILDNAASAGLPLSERTAFMADMDLPITGVLPYTPYGLTGSAYAYFGEYNVFALGSGANNSFYLYDAESNSRANVRNTSSDTLEALGSNAPEISSQMAVAAQIVYDAVTAEGFRDACVSDMDGINAYAWLNNSIAGYIVVASLSLVALVLIVVFVRRYEGKHRETPEIKRNVKVAVFGMDYEDPNENDVFVDIRPRGKPVDPFDIDPFGDDPEPDRKDDGDGKDDDKNDGKSDGSGGSSDGKGGNADAGKDGDGARKNDKDDK